MNQDLLSAERAAGRDVVLLVLERMTLYQQLVMLRRCTVLVGVHGSGLTNSIFMEPNTVRRVAPTPSWRSPRVVHNTIDTILV